MPIFSVSGISRGGGYETEPVERNGSGVSPYSIDDTPLADSDVNDIVRILSSYPLG